MLVSRDSCPICRSRNAKSVFCAPYADAPVRTYVSKYYCLEQRNLHGLYYRMVGDGNYELKACPDCNAIYQSSFPGEEFSQIIYSQWIQSLDVAEDNAAGFGFEAAKHFITEALKLVKMMLRITGKISPGDLRVLDFGMGRGGFALALKACGCHVFGYDFAYDRQAVGTKLGITMIEMNDLDHLLFDFINTEQVFEHLPHPLDTARQLAAALCTNGVLKISVPFNRWLENGDVKIDWNAERYDRNSPIPNAPLEHLQYFRRPSLDRLGRSVGLVPVNLTASEHLNHSLGWLNPKEAIKNVGRALYMDRYRNYRLFQQVR